MCWCNSFGRATQYIAAVNLGFRISLLQHLTSGVNIFVTDPANCTYMNNLIDF